MPDCLQLIPSFSYSLQNFLKNDYYRKLKRRGSSGATFRTSSATWRLWPFSRMTTTSAGTERACRGGTRKTTGVCCWSRSRSTCCRQWRESYKVPIKVKTWIWRTMKPMNHWQVCSLFKIFTNIDGMLNSRNLKLVWVIRMLLLHLVCICSW